MTQKIRNGLRALLAAALILALGAGSASASGYSAWVNNSKAKLYTSDGESKVLHAGAQVHVNSIKNGWAQIKRKNGVGYVAASSLTLKKGLNAYVCKSKAYVYKKASKKSAKAGPIPVGTELKVVGVSGKFYQVTNGKYIGFIPQSKLSKSKPSEAAVIAGMVQLVNWNKANKLVEKGKNASVYDIQSGITFRVHRLGGSLHMELEPLTADDTAKMLKMCGGKFSWDSRPVILYTNGKALAAAINTMPHGEQTIQNNDYDGQFCMHFPGSRTHGTNTENASHQAAIKLAYKWARTMVK